MPADPDDPRFAEEAARALSLVCASLPHLAPLAYAVRLSSSPSTPTASVTASGHIRFGPAFWRSLTLAERAFVLAHELMHLALDTFGRGEGSERSLVNIAHDYILNDMLAHALGQPVPGGGLVWPGAREKSLEELVSAVRADPSLRRSSWGAAPAKGRLGRALAKAGLVPDTPAEGDLADDDGDDGDRERSARVAEAAAHTRALATLERSVREGLRGGPSGPGPTGGEDAWVEAHRAAYRVPWERALQRWLEAGARARPTWSRASRRGDGGGGALRPGRAREGWTLHVVLDTSGSMESELGECLGAIVAFCEAAEVDRVRVVQCDSVVTRDDSVTPDALARYATSGYGGSDMTPALEHLACDPEVSRVLVLTDGGIEYPAQAPPFEVMWVVTGDSSFEPTYGEVVRLELGR